MPMITNQAAVVAVRSGHQIIDICLTTAEEEPGLADPRQTDCQLVQGKILSKPFQRLIYTLWGAGDSRAKAAMKCTSRSAGSMRAANQVRHNSSQV